MKRLLCVVMLVCAVGCPWVKKEGATIVDCTVQAVETHARFLLPAVIAILHGEAPNWSAQLDALKALGEDVLACTLAQAAMQLEAEAEGASTMPAGSPEALKAKAEAVRGRDHAASYMKTMKVQPKCASPASAPAEGNP